MQAVGVGTPRGTKRDKQAMRIVARLARAQIDTAGHFLLDGDSNNLFWDQQEIAELMRAPRLHCTKHRWCNFGIFAPNSGAPSNRLSRVLSTYPIADRTQCACGRRAEEHSAHLVAPMEMRGKFVEMLLGLCTGTQHRV